MLVPQADWSTGAALAALIRPPGYREMAGIRDGNATGATALAQFEFASTRGVAIPEGASDAYSGDLLPGKLSLAGPIQGSPGEDRAAMTGWGPQEAEFCARRTLGPYVNVARDLIHKHFPNSGEPEWQYERDYESPHAWLSITFQAGSDLTEALQRYNALTEEWVEAVPWPQADDIVFDFEVD